MTVSDASNRGGPRCRVVTSALCALVAVVALGSSLRAEERHLQFLQQLKERYPDLALEYARRLDQRRKELPPEVSSQLDLEYAAVLIAASSTRPLEEAEALLEEAAQRLNDFIAAHQGTVDALRAGYQLGLLWMQRGQHYASRAQRQSRPAADLLQQARNALQQARNTLLQVAADARRLLRDRGQQRKRRRKRASSDEVLIRGIEQFAQLQAALALYHQALTYDKRQRQFSELLEKASEEFDRLFQQHRLELTLPARFAHLWHGRCLQELGRYDDAIDLYDEVLVSEPPNARAMSPEEAELYTQAYLFRLECMEALGQVEAIFTDPVYNIEDWLKTHRVLEGTPEYAAVQFFAARLYIAQAKRERNASRQQQAYRRALELLTAVSRTANPHQLEALRLRSVVEVQLRGRQAEPRTWDEAVALADLALDSKSWAEAIRHYEKALTFRKRPENPVQVATILYKLAFAYYQANQPQKAADVALRVLRDFPDSPVARDAANLALYGYYVALRSAAGSQQGTRLAEELLELCAQVEKLWTDEPVADVARRFEGLVLWYRGDYERAAEAFARVTKQSPDYADSMVKAGKALWTAYTSQRSQLSEEQARRLLEQTLRFVDAGIQAAQDDRVRIEGMLAKVDVLLQMQRLADAKKVAAAALDLVRRTTDPAALAYRLTAYTVALQLASQTGDVETVHTLVNELATAAQSGTANVSPEVLVYVIAQLAKQVGKLTEPRQKQQLEQTLQDLLKLVDTEALQDDRSREHIAEAYFALGDYAQALALYNALLTNAPPQRAWHYRARLARCYVALGRYEEAYRLMSEAIAQYERAGKTAPLVLLLERAKALHHWAEQEPSHWRRAYREWAQLYNSLVRRLPRPREFYEVTYYLGVTLKNLNRTQEAKRLVQRTLRASRTCGGPDLRAKLQNLLAELD